MDSHSSIEPPSTDEVLSLSLLDPDDAVLTDTGGDGGVTSVAKAADVRQYSLLLLPNSISGSMELDLRVVSRGHVGRGCFGHSVQPCGR